MTCDTVQDYLLGLEPDGDIYTNLPAWMQEHLVQCASCRGLRNEVVELQRAWQEPSATPSEGRVERVMQEVCAAKGETKVQTVALPSLRARGRVNPVHGSLRMAGSMRGTLWNYGIAVGLAFVLLNSGFFSHLGTSLNTADARLSAYVQGGIQYVTHISF